MSSLTDFIFLLAESILFNTSVGISENLSKHKININKCMNKIKGRNLSRVVATLLRGFNI